MQQQNIREYGYMRDEVSYIKQCITTYISFLLGGSGAALFAFNIATRAGDAATLIVSMTAFGMSVLIGLLFIIVQYKFNSHNRGAGYLKLLSHERISLSGLDVETHKKYENVDFIGWEICIDRLRDSILAKTPASQQLKEIGIHDVDLPNLEKALSHLTDNITTESKTRLGLRIWRSSFQNKARTKSWGYPIYVTQVFSVVTFLFYMIGAVFAFDVLVSAGETTPHKITVGVTWLLITVLQISAWRYHFAMMYKLLQGNNTVDAYCLQLLPMRTQFLNSMDLSPSYKLLAESIASAINPLEGK